MIRVRGMMVFPVLIGSAWARTSPAFGHPPLRGEGLGEPSGDRAKSRQTLAPLSSEERGWG